MSTTTSEVRDGLKAAIERIADLPAERTWPGQVNPPVALIRVIGIDYAESFDSMSVFHCEVTVVVRFADLESGHDDLDEYVDPHGERSIAANVELDQTLGGRAEIVNVLRMHDFGDLKIADAVYLGAIFDVDVYAT